MRACASRPPAPAHRASLAYRQVLFGENSTAARTSIRLSYCEANQGISLVRGAHPPGLPPAPSALAGFVGTGTGRHKLRARHSSVADCHAIIQKFSIIQTFRSWVHELRSLGMYQSIGKHQETSPARLQKTGPLRDRLRQVETDRVFGSHSGRCRTASNREPRGL